MSILKINTLEFDSIHWLFIYRCKIFQIIKKKDQFLQQTNIKQRIWKIETTFSIEKPFSV